MTASPETPGPPGPPEPLDPLVRAEAHRLTAELQIQADPARLAEGWERRFVVDGARVAEYVQLYESLGFEAVADPVRAEGMAEDCTDCRIVALLQFRMLYTRAKRT